MRWEILEWREGMCCWFVVARGAPPILTECNWALKCLVHCTTSVWFGDNHTYLTVHVPCLMYYQLPSVSVIKHCSAQIKWKNIYISEIQAIELAVSYADTFCYFKSTWSHLVVGIYRLWLSGLWHCVVWQEDTNVSEEGAYVTLHPENGGIMFLWNVGIHLDGVGTQKTTEHTLPWKAKNLNSNDSFGYVHIFLSLVKAYFWMINELG